MTTLVRVGPPEAAAVQMARDAALLEDAEAGAPAVVRLYGFAGRAITVGRSQDPAEVLDLERCRADGIDWAVRPTGGGPVLHAEEWTFGFATALGRDGWPTSPRAVHVALAEWLAEALRVLGAPVAAAPRGERPVRAAGPVEACFARVSRHELLVDGRKVGGLAQRVTRRAALVQGSLVTGPGHRALPDYLRGDPAWCEAQRVRLREQAGDLGAWLGSGAPSELLARALETAAPRLPAFVGGIPEPGIPWGARG